MPLSSSLTASLSKIADLNEDNWGKWSKDFIMFFRGCSATWITAATATSGVPDDKKGLDGELVWAIYSHVSETFQPLIQDATSGLEAWRLLKKRFEKSTMARRIKARSDFYHAAHDPHLPIDIYINKVTACRGILKGLGCEPSDTETADVLLMNLHPSWSGVRTSITSNKDEQSLDDVKAILNGSSVDPPAKDEDVDTPLAFAASNARFGSGGRKGGAGGGNGYNGGGASGRNGYNGGGAGGGNGYNGSGGGQSNDGTCHDEHVSDDKGYRWCDPTNENHCHRCGRTGHIAARCIHDMPQHIKDWVMNPRTRANMATMEHANNNYVLGYDFNLDVGSDSDNEHAPKYSNGVQIPLRI